MIDDWDLGRFTVSLLCRTLTAHKLLRVVVLCGVRERARAR